MASWTFEQHIAFMTRQGVVMAARHGDGRGTPLREEDGSIPVRDVARERHWMERYLAAESSRHLAKVESLNSSLPPMNDDCRISVLLPCRNEGQHVKRILALLADQRRLDGAMLPSNSFEILVLANTMSGERTDDTEGLARRWSADSRATIHVIRYQHPADEPAPLTMARKLLADIALLRGLRRSSQRASLYLASEDADIYWLDPAQLDVMVRALDAAPALDALRGQQDRCPWLIAQFATLFLMRRSWNFLETHLASASRRPERNPHYDFNWNRIVTSGWNTVFSAEAYARIRGYTPIRRFEEDMDIGEKLSVLRAFWQDGKLVPQVNTVGRLPTRSEGSPRRWIYRIIEDVEPYIDRNNYENFFRLDHEQNVKFATLDELAERARHLLDLTDAGSKLLESLLQNDFRFALRRLRQPGHALRVYRRVLHALGFGPGDVELHDDGNLTLGDTTGPQQRWLRYRQRYSRAPVPPDRLLAEGLRRTWHGLPVAGRS